jgi:hypothetical protein
MTFKVSESTLGLKKAKKLGKYKIFLMTGYIILNDSATLHRLMNQRAKKGKKLGQNGS